MFFERSVRAPRGVGPERLLRTESLVFEVSVHRPVNSVERSVWHSIGPETERDAEACDATVRIVAGRPNRSESVLVDVARAAPLSDEVRLATGDEARLFGPPEDLVVGQLVVLDPVTQRLSRAC